MTTFTLWLALALSVGVRLIPGIRSQVKCLCNDNNRCIMNKVIHKNVTKGITSRDKLTEYARKIKTFGMCPIDAEGRCYMSKDFVKENNAYVQFIRYGCLSSHSRSTLSCNGDKPKHDIPKTISCCNNSDFCNLHLNPNFTNHESEEAAKKHAQLRTIIPATRTPSRAVRLAVLVLFCSGVVALIASLATVCYLSRKRARTKRMEAIMCSTTATSMTTTSMLTGTTGPEFTEPCLQRSTIGGVVNSSTSGTGSGPLLLVQRTVGKQLSLHDCIGRGRYAEVWAGELRSEPVAIKLFDSGPEGDLCWRHETRLHQRVHLRHDAILGLVAADRLAWGSLHRPVLVTELIVRGSLRSWLSSGESILEEGSGMMGAGMVANKVAMDSGNSGLAGEWRLMRFVESIVCGLCYLHTEMAGTVGKPGMAHRDLTSSNIYVKEDWTCCIGDLCFAVTQQQVSRDTGAGQSASATSAAGGTESADLLSFSEDEPPLVGGLQPGTPRYMAPEVLQGRLNPLYLDGFKKADVYSLGLVIWEMVRWMSPLAHRLEKDGHYFPPYQDLLTGSPEKTEYGEDIWLPGDEEPCVEELEPFVCAREDRPRLPSDWTENVLSDKAPVTELLINLMTQCWHDNPDYRLTSLRMKKSLSRLTEELANRKQEPIVYLKVDSLVDNSKYLTSAEESV